MSDRFHFPSEEMAWSFAKRMVGYGYYVADYGVDPSRAVDKFFVDLFKDYSHEVSFG